MAFISEIHYQNTYAAGSGGPEFVEVTLSPAEMARAGDFVLATYQTTGGVRTQVTLASLTPVIDPVTGYGVYTLTTPVTDPDHTSGPNEAEAVALVDTGGAGVIAFYDIGGGTTAITATSGPAAGATSVNIAASAPGSSIQFDIFGNRLDGSVNSGTSVVCFAAGTLIRTPDGERPVEALAPGDPVLTMGHGAEPLVWTGHRHLTAAELAATPHLRPVRIPAGALGPGLPQRDLLVSPQHRILIGGAWLDLCVAAPECLVSARALARAWDRVAVDPAPRGVSYHHILFAAHRIVWAEGAPSESFYPGVQALRALHSAQRYELLRLFPELACGLPPFPRAAYPDLRPREAGLLRLLA